MNKNVAFGIDQNLFRHSVVSIIHISLMPLKVSPRGQFLKCFKIGGGIRK